MNYRLEVTVCNCTTRYRGKLQGEEIHLGNHSFTINQSVFQAGSYIHAVPFRKGCQFIIDLGHDQMQTNILMFDIPPHRVYYLPLPGQSFDRVLEPNELIEAIKALITALRDGKGKPGISFSQWLSHLPRNPAPNTFSPNTT